MPRLPKEGSDEGNWGKILNEFLLVEHATDGSLKKGPEIDTLKNDLDTKLAKSGGTLSGDLDMATNHITNLGDPQTANDAATKGYVDAQGTTSTSSLAGTGAKRAPSPMFTVYDPLESGWSDAYGRGTVTLDAATFFEGSTSLKIVTNVAGSDTDFCGMSKTFSGDWSKKSFRIVVRAIEWSKVNAVMVDVSTSGNFDSYFTASINQSNNLVNPANNEWIELVIPRASFTTGGGTPSWATANAVALKAVAKTGQQATVWIDGFAAYDDASRGICSVVFDDGKLSQYTNAKKYMDKYGFRGTAFIIPDYIGDATHMTQAQLDEMDRQGWDIAGHGESNLTTLASDQRKAEFKKVKQYLVDHGYKGADLYAYPNSATNDTIKAEISQYFSYARTIENLGQSRSYVVPHYIQGKNIFEGLGSINYIKGLIDRALANGEWLILLFHQVLPTGSGADITQTKFNQIMDYLNQTGTEVVPMSEALEKRITTWDDIAGDATISKTTISDAKYDHLNDTNGNRSVDIVPSVNAVNYLSVVNAATNNPITLRADGSSTNIDLLMQSKGTGIVKMRSSAGLTIANFTSASSPANYLIFANGASGNAPYIQAAGLDADVGLSLRAKNGGAIFIDGALKIKRTGINNTDYNVAANDHLIAFTALSASRTATLPSASTASGVTMTIKDESGLAGTHNIQITTSSGNIDGVASKAITTNYGSMKVYSNGTNWFTLN